MGPIWIHTLAPRISPALIPGISGSRRSKALAASEMNVNRRSTR